MAPLCWIHDPSPFTSKSFHNDLSAGTHQTHDAYIAGLIPQSPQLQAQVRSASLCWCHKSGKCAKSCARRSVCCCSQSGGGASIGLLTQQLQSCDWDRRGVRFVRLALKAVMQNYGDFVGIILLYLKWTLCSVTIFVYCIVRCLLSICLWTGFVLFVHDLISSSS